MSEHYDYDVIIIGAGIGGLVCGCYLARAGLKTLIVEKNAKPGGCCSSFKRDGFTFDSGVFSLGDCRPEGNLGKVIKDLKLKEFIKLKRIDPSDIISIPGYKIIIKNNLKEIINEFRKYFPDESIQIKKFFNFLAESSTATLFVKLKNLSFGELLNNYFHNAKLKLILNTILATFGQPPNLISAVTAAVVLKEFILDGGYYPKGGIQSLANGLTKVFKKMGGIIKFSNQVKKILIKNITAKGIILKNGRKIYARFLISNCDLTYTFYDLIGKRYLNNSLINNIDKAMPSISGFMVFLGLKRKIKIDYKCKYWCTLNNAVDDYLLRLWQGNLSNIGDHLLISFPSFYDSNLAPDNKDSVCILVSAPFMNKKFWDKNKNKLTEKIIKKAIEIIPDFRDNILFKEAATPITYNNFTFNREGATYGWACTPIQVKHNILEYNAPFKRLFFVGHWTRFGFGVSRVALSGYSTSRLVLLNYNKDKI